MISFTNKNLKRAQVKENHTFERSEEWILFREGDKDQWREEVSTVFICRKGKVSYLRTEGEEGKDRI